MAGWVAPLISAGMSLLSSGGGDDDSWKADAERAGKREAGLMANRGRALELLPAKIRRESEAAAMAKVQSQKDMVAAKSEAVVAAAAAGVR